MRQNISGSSPWAASATRAQCEEGTWCGAGAAYARLIAGLGGAVTVHDGGVERDGSGGDHSPAQAVAHDAGSVRQGPITSTAPQEWEALRPVGVDRAFLAVPRSLAGQAAPGVRPGRADGASGSGLEAWDAPDVTASGVGKAAQFGLMNALAGEAEAAGTRPLRHPARATDLPPEQVAAAVALPAPDDAPDDAGEALR